MMTRLSKALFSLKIALLVLLLRVAAICRCSINCAISCCGFMLSPSGSPCSDRIFCL